jgi:cytochrome P450
VLGEDVSAPDVLDLDALGRALTQEPHPVYAALRSSRPVTPVVLHGLRGWLVTGYDDVRATLGCLSNDRRNATPAARSAGWLFADEALSLQHHMLRSDPPDHTRLRRLAAPAFSPRRVAALRPRIAAIAEELVDGFAPTGRAELVSQYAFPLPHRVIVEVLGVPAEDAPALMAWSDLLSSGRATQDEVLETLGRMRTFFSDCADRVRRRPQQQHGDGLLDVLVRARDAGQLDDAEFFSTAFQLLQGGHVTTLGAIANGVLALLTHPEQLAALRADPGLLDAAVDELLRFDAPMEVATVRFTTRDVRIGDVDVPGDGQPVLLALTAANRDPAHFDRPDALDLRREPSGHLSFGHGVHHCLGAHLARAEVAIALSTLLRRLPDLELAVEPGALAWRDNPHLRRPEQLPVAFSRTDPSGTAPTRRSS